MSNNIAHQPEQLEHIEKIEQWLDLSNLNQQEFSNLMEETIPEEIQTMIAQKELFEKALSASDQAWEQFLIRKWSFGKGEYIRTEKLLFSTLADPIISTIALKNSFVDYCTVQIKQCNNQYRYIKNNLLPTATWPQKIVYERACTALADIQGKWEEIKTTYQPDYTEVIQLLKNKKDNKKYEAMKMDPRNRYEKDDLKKAKKLVEEWPPRSANPEIKYLAVGPITRKDAGKCGITDHYMLRNEEILKNIGATMKKREAEFKKQKHTIVQWKEGMEITIPDTSDILIELTTLTQNLKSELADNSIDISRMTAKLE